MPEGWGSGVIAEPGWRRTEKTQAGMLPGRPST